MAGPPKPRIIYALKTEQEGGITLIITNLNNLREGRISGMIIEQKGGNDKHVIFKAQESATILILKEQVIVKIEVECIEDGQEYLIPVQDYNSMIQELMKQDLRDEKIQGDDQNDQNEGSEHSSDDSDKSENYESENSRMDRHKNQNHIKNELDYQNSNNHNYSYENDDSNNDKRRGRPKGSKNKKTLTKEILENNQIIMELKMVISDKIKRGKGRPKGSKNKRKQMKYDHRDMVKMEQGDSAPFGKRGKGRPKGSKKKIKALNTHIVNEDQSIIIQKRGRGRPKGAKNKANSVASGTLEQQVEQQFVEIEYNEVDLEPFQNAECCAKCSERVHMRKIVMGQQEGSSDEEQVFEVHIQNKIQSSNVSRKERQEGSSDEGLSSEEQVQVFEIHIQPNKAQPNISKQQIIKIPENSQNIFNSQNKEKNPLNSNTNIAFQQLQRPSNAFRSCSHSSISNAFSSPFEKSTNENNKITTANQSYSIFGNSLNAFNKNSKNQPAENVFKKISNSSVNQDNLAQSQKGISNILGKKTALVNNPFESPHLSNGFNQTSNASLNVFGKHQPTNNLFSINMPFKNGHASQQNKGQESTGKISPNLFAQPRISNDFTKLNGKDDKSYGKNQIK